MSLTVLFLRHGAHDRGDDLLCGRLPGVSLGAEGARQAACLARRFPPGTLQALYTSPVQRCRETAAALEATTGLAARVDTAAEEVDFGDWTGQRFAALEMDARWKAWNRSRDDAAAPGGESMQQVRSRVTSLLQELLTRHPSGEVAVVTHAEVIRTAALHLLGLPLQAYDRLEISPASITALAPGEGRVLGLNDVSHLKERDTRKEAA